MFKNKKKKQEKSVQNKKEKKEKKILGEKRDHLCGTVFLFERLFWVRFDHLCVSFFVFLTMPFGAPKCPRCGKSVYFAERQNVLGKDWHKTCVNCETCKKHLEPGNYNDNEVSILCRFSLIQFVL